jgi:hypothetical protein
MEIVAVPGGEPRSAVIDVFLRHVFAPRYDIRLADAIDAAAFRHRLARPDHAGAGRRAVSGIDPARQAAIGAIGKRQTASYEA